MFSDSELYNVHFEIAGIEKWSIFSTKVGYIEHNRKELPTKKIKCCPTEGKCQKDIGK